MSNVTPSLDFQLEYIKNLKPVKAASFIKNSSGKQVFYLELYPFAHEGGHYDYREDKFKPTDELYVMNATQFKFEETDNVNYYRATILNSSDNSNYIHPHVQYEGSGDWCCEDCNGCTYEEFENNEGEYEICWGDASMTLQEAYQRRDWMTFTHAVMGWASTFNAEDAYTSIEELDQHMGSRGWVLPPETQEQVMVREYSID